MNKEQIKERIENATAKIEKKENTILKKSALIEKKTAQTEKETDENEKRYLLCEIRYLEEDIKRLNKEIESLKATIEKYNKQMDAASEKENILSAIPAEFNLLKEQLVKSWDEFDKERREVYRNEYHEVGYKEFFKKRNGADYELIRTSDEEIHKKNTKDAELMILDLYNRIHDITGTVTSWKRIRAEMGNAFPVLTGIVEGEKGKANVETVLAGGYNIQRLHVRTLVHKI